MADQDLNALVSSRICHDLANPLGAVGNGIELLEMTVGKSAEMDLITDALAQATARMGLFRIAFGAAPADQTLSNRDALAMTEALSLGGRHQIAWDLGDSPRPVAKRALLGVLALESALPLGGTITVHPGPVLRGEGRRVEASGAIWQALAHGQMPQITEGAQVHFAVLAQVLMDAGIVAQITADQTWIELRL